MPSKWRQPLMVDGTGGFKVDKRRFRLERDLENAAVKRVHARGFVTRKMNGLGFSSWPDRLVIWPERLCMYSHSRSFVYVARQEYVEFKLPGEEPTPLQLKLHRDLRALGCVVYVCDNLEHFDAITATRSR